MSAHDVLEFYVNGEKISVGNPSYDLDLLTYLRKDLGLCGTKRGCGTGACGSCTVNLSQNGKHFVGVNACLVKVASLHNSSITTIEGLGNPRDGLHPIQERIYKAHGSQCGFCTPGMVMSMNALLCENPCQDVEDIAYGLTGNLCRCTGYSSILRGFNSFSKEGSRVTLESNDVEDGEELLLFDINECQATWDDKSVTELKSRETAVLKNDEDRKLKKFQLADGRAWYRPRTLDQMFSLQDKLKRFEIFGGGTGTFKMDQLEQGEVSMPIIQIGAIDELKRCSFGNEETSIGCGLTIQEISQLIVVNSPERKVLCSLFSYLACRQIRNVATVGGWVSWNHATSDLKPVLLALKAKVLVRTIEDGKIVVPFEKVTDQLKKNCICLSLVIPRFSDGWEIRFYRKARRSTFDLAIANACVAAKFDQGVVQDLNIAFGGKEFDIPGVRSGILVYRPEKLINSLIGMKRQEISKKTIETYLKMDLVPIDEKAPGYTSELRLSLLIHFVRSFFAHSGINKEVEPKSTNWPRSKLTFQKPDANQSLEDPVSRPISHLWAAEQACGTAIFVDDIKPFVNELQIVPIQSERAHARVLNIDFSRALAVEGVVGKICQSDMKPDQNLWGLFDRDEPVFSTEVVHYFGQIMAVLLCTDLAAGERAVKLISVQYEDLPSILSLKDAIEHKSFIGKTQRLSRCQLDLSKVDKKFNLKGSVHLGVQEMFYLEPHSVLAVPSGEKEELLLYLGTHEPCNVQAKISQMLNLTMNKIVVKVKRVGGSFGGKERMHNALIASFAAWKFKKPTRMIFSRKLDIEVTGHRHELLADYDVDFDGEGKLLRTELKYFANAGCSTDVSLIWVQALLARSDSGYTFTNFVGEATVCRTHTASNTSMRGFGSPEGAIVIEHILERIAHSLGKDPLSVRLQNISREGDLLHYGDSKLKGCTLLQCWEEVLKRGNYNGKREAIDTFNAKMKNKKRGIAVTPMKFAPSLVVKCLSQGAALVRIYLDGSVLVSHGGVEMGQGLNTKIIQVASRALEVSHEKIHIMDTSSETVPNATATGASLGTELYGGAVMDACKKLTSRLEPLRKKNPDISWEELIARAYSERINLSATGFCDKSMVDFDFDSNAGVYTDYYTYGACVCVAEVDCRQGSAMVISADLVIDVGKSINPAIDIGQIEGAFVQALGYVTTEQLLMDLNTGQVLTTDPSTYKIPTVHDIPREFNVHLLRNDVGPASVVYSSKGIGEPATVCGATGISLAIRDAVANFRKEHGNTDWFQIGVPATIDKIKAALDEVDLEKYLEYKVKSIVEM